MIATPVLTPVTVPSAATVATVSSEDLKVRAVPVATSAEVSPAITFTVLVDTASLEAALADVYLTVTYAVLGAAYSFVAGADTATIASPVLSVV